MARDAAQRADMATTEFWVFDVDGCLFDSDTGRCWRPGATRLIQHLHDARCRVILWSAGGAEYARERALDCKVGHLFHGFHYKERRDANGKYLVHFIEDLTRAVLVDDRPEDLPTTEVEVIAVRPYLVENPRDQGLAVCGQRRGISLFEQALG